MSYDLTPLHARRVRERRGRKRNRRLQAVLAALTVAFAVAAVALALSGSSTHAPRAPQAVVRPGPTPRFRIRPRSRVADELAAIHRITAYGRPVYCGGHRGRMIALTFDDGPGVYTRLALRKLSRAHARATFFLVGRSILAFPRLARLERGFHAVDAFGDHTMTHPFLPALSHAAVVGQLVAARALIERTVRQPVVLFRPPYGGHSKAIDAEVRRLRMAEILWNVDSADSLGANYAGIEHNVIDGLRAGSIILMHENRGQTIRALPVIFRAIRRRHLDAVTVPQLLTADPPTPRQLREGWRGCDVALRRGNGA